MLPLASWDIIRAEWFPCRPSNTGNTVTTRRASVNSQSTLLAYKDKEDPGLCIYSNLRWYLYIQITNILIDTINLPPTVLKPWRPSKMFRKTRDKAVVEYHNHRSSQTCAIGCKVASSSQRRLQVTHQLHTSPFSWAPSETFSCMNFFSAWVVSDVVPSVFSRLFVFTVDVLFHL